MEAMVMKYNKNPIVGDIYNLSNLRCILDDFLNEYLARKNLKRNNIYTDLRNTIGIAATIITIVILYFSMYFKFEIVKAKIFFCIVLYFLLYILKLIVENLENGRFYYKEFCISTRADTVPVYVILVYKKNNPVPHKYSKSILDLFYENGHLDHKLFLNDLETFITKEVNLIE